jgi:hypothetical protein
VSTAAQLRTSFFEENLRDLNRVVFAAEALEAPKLPDVPDWEEASPDSFELDKELTLEEAKELGLKWQVLAGKLHDLLIEATAPDAWGDVENVVAGLRDKAKAARAALVRLDAYDPPVKGSP